MGEIWSKIVSNGWLTPVKEVYKSSDAECDTGITLKDLKEFAKHFSEKVSNSGDVSFDMVATKTFVISVISTGVKQAREALLSCLKIVVGTIVQKILKTSGDSRKILLQSMKEIALKISKEAVDPLIRKFFKDIARNALVQDSGSKLLQAVQALSVSGTEKGAQSVAREGVKTAAKESARTAAKQSAISAAKVGAVVDGMLLAYTVTRSAYRYRNGDITGNELRRTVMRRSSAAVGSVGLSAAGAFVGTLVAPGAGTFIGGWIGGMAGDYMGSWFGAKVDDKLDP